MSKFKGGDRVAVYDLGIRKTGRVDYVRRDGSIEVRTDGGGAGSYHSKQCRRLVKKPRRRVWVEFKNDGSPVNVRKKRPTICNHDDPSWCDEECFDPNYIGFIEVGKKK